MASLQLPLLTQPPAFCEYAGGACDQTFDGAPQSEALFLYPNDPQIIAATIEEAASRLRLVAGGKHWRTWKDLGIVGRIIFCEVCKATRYAKYVVADLTTLNFNLLFEVGYAIGLGIPVLPIRDTSFIKDTKVFTELGLIDTLGYFDFQNVAELVNHISSSGCPPQVLPSPQSLDKEKPLYVMKSPVQSEGMVRLMSAVKKSGLRFRSFDPRVRTPFIARGIQASFFLAGYHRAPHVSRPTGLNASQRSLRICRGPWRSNRKARAHAPRDCG